MTSALKILAAEVIYQRADAEKDNMGLTSWAGREIKRSDFEIAKNYLNEKAGRTATWKVKIISF